MLCIAGRKDKMYKLIVFECGNKHEFKTETLEESLSLAMDAYNQGHELHAIEKDGVCLLLHCEVYKAIGKVIY